MKVMIGFLFVLAAMFGAGSAGAQTQEKLTLEEAQKEALAHSPLYRQSESAEREAGWGQFEAFSNGFLPQVSVNAQHFFSEQYATTNINFGGEALSFPGIFPQTNVTLDASFDVFDGFQNVHKLDSAAHQHDAAKILSDFASLQLVEQVRMKFYEALAAQILSDMSDEDVKVLEDHQRVVHDQLQNGQATRYDAIRVEVQLSEAQSDQISAHDNVVIAREVLAQTMGLKNDDRVLSGQLPVLAEDDVLGRIDQMDPATSPELKAAQLRALAAEDQSTASHASLWVPKVSLVGEYELYNNPDYLATGITGSDDYRNEYFVGAALSWNILDGGLSVARANEADEKSQQSHDDLEERKLQTPNDFDMWKRRLVSGMAVYRARLTNGDRAKESVRLAKLGFQAGTRTTTDVLDAELEEFRASSELVQAQVSALEALIHLELLTGKEI
jgi:outer membrane protein TolC